MISKETATAVEKARRLGLSFALYTLPSEKDAVFFASDSRVSHGTQILDDDNFNTFNGFLFNFFSLDDKLHAYGIRPELTARDVIELDGASFPAANGNLMPALQKSTDYVVYQAQIKKIISELKGDEEKTVISHIVNLASTVSPIELAKKYFNRHSGCFRFLYSTPESGLWIGASPELLLEYNYADKRLRSMSLAGTRRSKQAGTAWDDKNIIEHDLVTRHIVSVLNKHCEIVDTPKADEIKFGNVTHLCHHISAYGDVDIAKLIPELSPTPALLGWPRERAYQQIIDTESHIRGCYGGFVGIKDPTKILLYVNLRSAMSVPLEQNYDGYPIYGYNLYGGGGITSRSKPEEEWKEAKLKIRTLERILQS